MNMWRFPRARVALFGFIFTALLLISAQAHAGPGLLLYVPNLSDGTVSVYRTNADGSLTSAGTIAVGSNTHAAVLRGDQAFAYVLQLGGRHRQRHRHRDAPSCRQ